MKFSVASGGGAENVRNLIQIQSEFGFGIWYESKWMCKWNSPQLEVSWWISGIWLVMGSSRVEIFLLDGI